MLDREMRRELRNDAVAENDPRRIGIWGRRSCHCNVWSFLRFYKPIASPMFQRNLIRELPGRGKVTACRSSNADEIMTLAVQSFLSHIPRSRY